jgi:tetratricopeptide (TPR) repeat protein
MPTGQVGRYRVLGEIGRGGMGAVLRSHDPELGRDLALKLMLGDPVGHPEAVQRFREEAQVGGQLQHPGVVPVYELGNADDGRPYFTMKLVKGVTLAHLLKERSSPSQERPRFLKIFEQVCQAVASAHAKGVIHRDLKPGNVMVGAFGEVQVMDWGLAKLLARGEDTPLTSDALGDSHPLLASPSVIKISRPNSANAETQEGDVLGTPAYMPPEQALGEINRLDERCDVFSLGAILCEILAGRPPYTAADRVAVLRQARKAELGEALGRLEACEADEELVELARCCLSADLADRPGDAGEVARAVEGYLVRVEERARQAELDRAAAEAREVAEKKQAEEAQARAVEAERRAAAERQARRLTLGLAVSVLLMVLAGSGGAWLWQKQQTEQAKRHERIEQTLTQGVQQAQQIRRELEEQLAKRGGVFELLDRPAVWKHKLVLAEAALQHARDLADGPEGPFSEELHAEIQTLQAWHRGAEADRELALQLEKIREDRSVLVSGKFDSAGALRGYAADFGRLGLKLQPGQEDADFALIQRSAIREQLVAALDDWASVAGSEKALDLQRRLFGMAVRSDPGPWQEIFRDQDDWKKPQMVQERVDRLLANKAAFRQLSRQMLVLMGELLTGSGGRAEAWLRQAQVFHPSDFWLNFTLGNVLDRAKKHGEAAGYYRAALAVRWQSSAAWNNLGMALRKQQKLDEAADALNKAIDLKPDDARVYTNLGNVLDDQKKWDEAVLVYRKALALQPDLAEVHNNLGVTLRAQQKLEEAIAAYKRAITLKPTLAEAYNNLGITLRAQRKVDEAVAAYQKAIDLQPEYALAYYNLGLAFIAQKQPDKAVAAWRRAIDLQPDSAMTYFNLGTALREQKKLDEAVGALQKAIQLQPDLGPAYNNLGSALHDQQKLAEAVAAFQKAIAIKPDHAPAYYNLANALAAQSKLGEAVAAFQKTIALKPDYAPAYHNLGIALRKQKKLVEAVVAFRKADHLLPNQPLIRRVLRQSERWLELDKQLPGYLASQAKPGSPQEQVELALVCANYREHYHAAVRFFADAFRTEPKLADDLNAQHRYSAARAAALAAAGKGDDQGKRDDQERARLRQQALDWLRADLTAYTGLASKGNPNTLRTIQQRLVHWEEDRDLSALRDERAVTNLAEKERAAWQQLWAAVAALQKKVDMKK